METTTTSNTTSTTMPTTPTHTLSATPVTKRPKARHSPYPKLNPILLSSDRRSRKRKSLSWQSDEKIQKVHYFEYHADERINVTRMNNVDQQNDANASANVSGGSSLNTDNKLSNAAGSKISNASVDPVRRSNVKTDSDKCIEYSPWRPLVLIDFTPELPSPGWNSIERSAQAERETYVLGAIDLPGQPSTLDEPDQQSKSGSSNGSSGLSATESSTKDGASNVKIIPNDNPEGMYIEYPNMYDCELVNGVRIPFDNPQLVAQNTPYSNQQSQLIPNQFQQQLVHGAQNHFNFQDMGAQFQQQQQAQMQIQFPFQQQQQMQPVQRFQQPIMPFTNQQQLQVPVQQQPAPFVDQQSGLTGPVMPWLSYPFNQVNENSQAHLFRRPAT